MRLKGKLPHPDRPGHLYESPELKKAAIDDVENLLIDIITEGPPFSTSQIDVTAARTPYDAPYMERHVYVHEPDPEIEDDVRLVHPVAWVPPQVYGRRIFEN